MHYGRHFNCRKHLQIDCNSSGCILPLIIRIYTSRMSVFHIFVHPGSISVQFPAHRHFKVNYIFHTYRLNSMDTSHDVFFLNCQSVMVTLTSEAHVTERTTLCCVSLPVRDVSVQCHCKFSPISACQQIRKITSFEKLIVKLKRWHFCPTPYRKNLTFFSG